jgi:hypothetical protein
MIAPSGKGSVSSDNPWRHRNPVQNDVMPLGLHAALGSYSILFHPSQPAFRYLTQSSRTDSNSSPVRRVRGQCPRSLGVAASAEIHLQMPLFTGFLQLARPLLCYGGKDR